MAYAEKMKKRRNFTFKKLDVVWIITFDLYIICRIEKTYKTPVCRPALGLINN
jgi:hypothetical protein